MQDYVYDPMIIRDNDTTNFSNVITANKIFLKKIFKHFGQYDKESKVLISIKLNNNDIENI